MILSDKSGVHPKASLQISLKAMGAIIIWTACAATRLPETNSTKLYLTS